MYALQVLETMLKNRREELALYDIGEVPESFFPNDPDRHKVKKPNKNHTILQYLKKDSR